VYGLSTNCLTPLMHRKQRGAFSPLHWIITLQEVAINWTNLSGQFQTTSGIILMKAYYKVIHIYRLKQVPGYLWLIVKYNKTSWGPLKMYWSKSSLVRSVQVSKLIILYAICNMPFSIQLWRCVGCYDKRNI